MNFRPCQLLLSACLLAISLAARADIIDIDNAELAKLLEKGVPLIDIRLQAEWEETGIVAGSHLNTFFDPSGHSTPAAWLERIKPYAAANQPVAIICRSGNRTRAVSRFLSQEAGYATVYNVKNGIKGWLADQRPLTPAAPAIAACRKDRSC
ncbi:MAG: rhodanese-like domain-containing protein [Azonexus sp.]|jgi:rhodanese-related sulfurtransferase|nr:rhodanese-like domain-containing protein [Azonexus sp.]